MSTTKADVRCAMMMYNSNIWSDLSIYFFVCGKIAIPDLELHDKNKLIAARPGEPGYFLQQQAASCVFTRGHLRASSRAHRT